MRQAYDPWGVQLSGNGAPYGYLGAQQRRYDWATGLIQMGARQYDPALGAFLSEDPVLGEIGVGVSANRYAYAWDNPLNLYDLGGRSPIGLSIFGNMIKNAYTQVVNDIDDWKSSAEHNAADWISNRASDFWKPSGDTLAAIYRFVGANWETCLQGGSVGATVGFVFATPLPVIGNGVGATIGGVGGCAALVGAKVGIESMGG